VDAVSGSRHRSGADTGRAALRCIGQASQPFYLLPIEIEFARVLQTQHHRMLGHARFGARHVGRQNVLPTQPAFIRTHLIKQSIGCLRLRLAIASARNAGRGRTPQAIRQFDQTIGQPCIAERCSTKLPLCPVFVLPHRLVLVDKRPWRKQRVYQSTELGYWKHGSAVKDMSYELCGRV